MFLAICKISGVQCLKCGSFQIYDSGGPELYLRCDKGNPGEVFDSIEAVSSRCCFTVGSNPNVKIDNICMKYACLGVAAGGVQWA